MTFCVGDEVDIHLGELWHRTIRLMGVNEAHESSTNTAPIRAEPELPRKEVIQPQLPLRLPCYDFVPITGPTLGRYPPPKRVGPRTSGVTRFHDVTGGVYKAREHIHRAVLTRGY